jgi:hypothetical protein
MMLDSEQLLPKHHQLLTTLVFMLVFRLILDSEQLLPKLVFCLILDSEQLLPKHHQLLITCYCLYAGLLSESRQ